MRRLDRYILRLVLRPMGATIFVTLLALLAERALSVIELVIGWRGSLFVVFEMLGYLIPHYMGLALPAAFFLGILFAFSRLAKESELDAMNAGGFGLARMARPLLALALITTLVHLALVSHLQPYSRYAYRAAVHAVTNVSFQTLLQPGRFVTLAGNTYFVDGISEDSRHFARLFLFSSDPEKGNAVVTAERGRLVSGGPMEPLRLELEDGVQQLLPSPPADGEAAADNNLPSALTVRFRHFVTDLSGRTPESFRPRGDDERELTLPELWSMRGQDHGTIEAHEIEAEFNGRLVRSLSIMVLPLLALPLSLGRRRAHMSYGFAVGVVVLVAYNQLIKTGESLVDDGVLGALPGLWAPFFGFTLGSLLLFWRAASTVPRPITVRLLEAPARWFERHWPRRRPA